MSWRYEDDAFDWNPEDPWEESTSQGEQDWSAAVETVLAPLRLRLLDGWAAFRRDADERGLGPALAVHDVSERELRAVADDYAEELRRRGDGDGPLSDLEFERLLDGFVLGLLYSEREPDADDASDIVTNGTFPNRSNERTWAETTRKPARS
jgi:hypothetical protein